MAIEAPVRNHLTEVQLRDARRLDALVRTRARPLVPDDLGDWAKGLDTGDAVQRSRGLFWSDATHPMLIPVRDDAGIASTCLQWVVCCSGNCTKTLHEVWSGMVEDDQASHIVRIHLLLNRASPMPDVESFLPYEGKVLIRIKKPCRLAIRLPRWADKNAARFAKSTIGTDSRQWCQYYDHPWLVCTSRQSRLLECEPGQLRHRN